MVDTEKVDRFEEKEEKKEGFLQTVDPGLLRWVTVATVALIFYLHFFTDADRNIKFAIIGVAVLILLINSRQSEEFSTELTCEESVIALDHHIRWWAKRDESWGNYQIYPDADVTEINDIPKFWLHTILFRKKIGTGFVDQWYIGKTEAFAPAKPRLFYFGSRPGPEELREVKEYLLSPKMEALQSKGLLKESWIRDMLGGK
jgi:hypothetical protein